METSHGGYGKWRTWIRWFFVAAAVMLVAALAYRNLAPFGATVTYRTDLEQESKNLSLPAPLETYTVLGEDPSGAVFQVTRSRMATDKADFEVISPYESLSSARVSVSYQGDPRELLLGLKSPSTGEYVYRPLHNRSLNDLGWDRLEDEGVTLFQKDPAYSEVGDFLDDLPGILDTPDGGEDVLARYHYELPYAPEVDLSMVNDGTYIENHLRGPHTFYVYVKDLPLSLGFTKQDINFSEGPDELTVTVHHGEELVHSLAVPDDGDVSQDRMPAGSQAASLELPGLEEGVYKVRFDCGEDVVVSDILSRQRYICLDGQVYLADNEMYSLGPTHPDTVFTNGRFLGAATLHYPNYQVVTVNDDTALVLDQEGKTVTTTLDREVSRIESEMSDVILMSEDGFFSFSEESLFKPFDDNYLRYSGAGPAKGLEYVIAGYTVPAAEGPGLSNTVRFDLGSTSIVDGRLSFQLYAPGLTRSKQELVLEAIEIVLEKD